MELSNSKFAKFSKLANKGKQIISCKHMISKSVDASLNERFKIKWIKKKKDNDGNEHEEGLENYRHKISSIEGVESCANRNLVNHDMNCKLDNGIAVIVNSCNLVVHPVARYCNRTILTQLISIVTSNVIKNNNHNLARPKDLLSIMSSNGKENIEILDEVLKIIS